MFSSRYDHTLGLNHLLGFPSWGASNSSGPGSILGSGDHPTVSPMSPTSSPIVSSFLCLEVFLGRRKETDERRHQYQEDD